MSRLAAAVPPDRRSPLERQLRLLHQSAGRHFPAREERELAEELDQSGIGHEERGDHGPKATDRDATAEHGGLPRADPTA